MIGKITKIDYDNYIISIAEEYKDGYKEPVDYRYDVTFITKNGEGHPATALNWIINKNNGDKLREVGETVKYFDTIVDGINVLRSCKLPDGVKEPNKKIQNFNIPTEIISDIRCSVISALGYKLDDIVTNLENGDEETYNEQIKWFKEIVDRVTKDLK